MNGLIASASFPSGYYRVSPPPLPHGGLALFFPGHQNLGFRYTLCLFPTLFLCLGRSVGPAGFQHLERSRMASDEELACGRIAWDCGLWSPRLVAKPFALSFLLSKLYLLIPAVQIQ